MNVTDDELDRLFRAANPVPREEAPTRLTAAEIAIREGIIRGTITGSRREKRRRPLVWAGLTTATAATAVAILVAVNVLMPTQQAAALAPPPLIYSDAPPLPEVLVDAEDALADRPDVDQSPGVRSEVWGWSVEMGEKRVEIVPQEITFDWAPGETATATIVAGDASWADGELPDGVEPSPYRPGEIIDTVVTAPEDFALPADALNLAGSSRDDMLAALAAFGAEPGASSGRLLSAITGLLDYWTLSDEQHATLLDLLDEAGGLTVRGETTDRLGRDVIGVRVASVIPERVETFFISVQTGRIVGVESELIEPLDSLPVGVISYTMWDAG